MSLIERLQRRIEELGRKRGFRVAVAAIFTLVVASVALKVYLEAARMHRLAEVVPDLLEQADLKAKEAVALELFEKGTVTVDGQAIGDIALVERLKNMFTEAGTIERVAETAAILLGTVRPPWLPGVLVDDPWIVLGAAAVAITLIWFACLSGLAVSLIGVALASTALWGAAMWFERPSLAISLSAIPLFLFAFALSVRVSLILLGFASPVFAVASGVVREAMRQRVAVAFAVVALVAIPLLPQWIDPEQPLRYQVQTFLSRSLDVMYLVCAILTVFLGSATVAFEIRDRQAWMTLTKPVSRFSWLLGKWLGIVAVNASILLVSTVAMYAFLVQVRARPAQDLFDALAIDDEVLVARIGGFPEYSRLGGEELQQAVESRLKSDPNLRAEIADGTRSEIDIKKQLAKTLVDENLKFQRSIGPGSDRVYRFDGLPKRDPRQEDQAIPNLTLRYKFYAGESDPNATYPVIFVFGTGETQSWTDRMFIAAQSNVITIPGDCVAPDGTLEVRILNAGFRPDARPGETPYYPGTATIAFDPDGVEVLYRVGGFADNLVRAQLVNLLKLSFLGMLSVTCASILSFPVACLVVFTLLAAGSIGPFLATSVAEYRIRTDSSFLKGVEFVIKAVAGTTEFSVRAFANARANGPLVEGRLVSWGDLGRTFALIGVAWSGVLLLLGVTAFRRKELAIYSGQGG